MILKTKHAMNSNPLVVDSETMISSVVSNIVDNNYDTVVVKKGNEIIGTVDLITVLKYTNAVGFKPTHVPIGEITDGDPIFARPNTSLEDVLGIMMEHRKSTIPVVDSDFVGTVNIYDILKRKNGKTGLQVRPELVALRGDL